jgi:hypothetical protein
VSPVKYELGSYISEDDIHHSHRRDNLISLNQTVPLALTVSVGHARCDIPWPQLSLDLLPYSAL